MKAKTRKKIEQKEGEKSVSNYEHRGCANIYHHLYEHC